MADRDGSARRKKKTKRQTIRVPVDEVPRRAGTGSAAATVGEEIAAEEVVEAGLTPVPDAPDESLEPARTPSRAQKTVVDMQLPPGMLEMFGEPTHDPSADDTAELSVDVDVSDAERPSVPPADPGDRPTPPPRQVSVGGFDPGDRPTPPPRAPAGVPAPYASATPRATPTPLAPPLPPPFGVQGQRTTPAPVIPPAAVPVSPPGVVVMAPIRSVGEPPRVVVTEPPEQAPEEPPTPLLRPQRFPTQHGVGPAVPPLVDTLDWAKDDSAVATSALPFDGALPGEKRADGAVLPEPDAADAAPEPEEDALAAGLRAAVTEEGEPEVEEEDEEEEEGDEDEEDEDEEEGDEEEAAAAALGGTGEAANEDEEELAREPTQVRRTRDDGTPVEVAGPRLAPSPTASTTAPATPVPPVPAPPMAPIPTPPPAAPAALLAPATAPIEVPPSPSVYALDGEAPREERDSDPGPLIDVDEEAEPPPPPPAPRTPSGPRMPAVVPPPPPGLAASAPQTTPPPAPPLAGPSLLAAPGLAVPVVPPPVPQDAARPESGERRRKGKKWWEDFFNEEWLRTIPQVPPETTRKECDFIESSLGVERAASLLDLGCGTGRHAVELAARGYAVVALDLSLPMLERAQAAADEREVKVGFQQADMRELSFESSFDAVYCLGTTLGLFDEDGNLQVIKNAHRALRENGTLLIEVVNRDYVLQAQPNLVWFEGDGCVCMEETNVNYITSRLHVKRTVMPDEGGQTETEYSVRLFSLHELGSLLHRNGFRVLEVSGHWATRGVFFGAHSQRLLVLAEKRPVGEASAAPGTQPSMPGVKADS